MVRFIFILKKKRIPLIEEKGNRDFNSPWFSQRESSSRTFHYGEESVYLHIKRAAVGWTKPHGPGRAQRLGFLVAQGTRMTVRVRFFFKKVTWVSTQANDCHTIGGFLWGSDAKRLQRQFRDYLSEFQQWRRDHMPRSWAQYFPEKYKTIILSLTNGPLQGGTLYH